MSDADSAGTASDGPFDASPALGIVVTRPRPDVTLLAVTGEIDTLTAPRLAAGLDEVLATAPGGAVVVDLTGVTFLSSSGLATLIRGARRATAADVPLRLVAVTRAVVRPLAVTGADALFDSYTDLGSALAASGTRPPADVAPPAPGGER